MSSSSGIPERHMKYPYTLTAKLVQFPYKYQFNTSYTFRYFLLGSAISSLIFWQINKLVYTPENKALTEKKREAERHYHYKRP